jgi:hypothetical protein
MRRLVLLILILTQGLVLADYPIEIIPLRHQTVEQMLPVLKPFAGDGGTVTGMNGQLIIKASPQNLQQLRSIVNKFDRTPRQLRILVRQGEIAQGQRRGVAVNGSIPVGEHGNISIGGSDDNEVNVHIQDRFYSRDSQADRYVRATEGMPAFIRTGVSVPLTTTYADHWGRYRVEHSYHDVASGFYVIPWINGNRVSLEISPFRGAPVGNSGMVRVQEINTRVGGRLGEWIGIGGIEVQDNTGGDGISGAGSRSSVSQMPVSVKVELLGE